MDENGIMIVMDWAMKFLPTRYREQMSDFYGKRGRSWHVACVISKTADGKLEVDTYVHLFNSCTQNWYAVASIIEDILEDVKTKYPNIDTAYLKSDNAGCYHNSQLLLSLPEIGKRTGITVSRYDFSDPQSGKDICDRKIAPMKAHIRRFVNEKNDVVTAEDMKKALESNGGVRGCNFIVGEIDTSQVPEASQTIEGISFLNNFSYETESVRCWKAYKHGDGVVVGLPVKQKPIRDQIKTGLMVKEHSTQPASAKGTISSESSASGKTHLYFCKEQGCVSTFSTYMDVEQHMDTGKHNMEEETDTTYDRIRKQWASKVSELQTTREQTSEANIPGTSTTSSTDRPTKPRGWALKVSKRAPRISDKVKKFLTEKFMDGVRTGIKADPAQVAKEIQRKKNPDGNLVFMPHEWRYHKQIASFFGRLSARQRHTEISSVSDVPTTSAEQEQEEIMWEEESERLRVRSAIFSELDLSHPLKYQQHNLCTLAKRRNLKQLKLNELKEICVEYEIQPLGPASRKQGFIKPLQSFIEQCTCFKTK